MTNDRPDVNIGPDSGEAPTGCSWKDERRSWRYEKRWNGHLHGFFWGLLLILLGVLFLASQQGWLTGDDWWHYLFVGLGGVFILDGLAHFFTGSRHYSFGRFIPGIVLLLVGLAFILELSEWWPAILIGVGIVILLGAFFRRR
jgi:hypothetical protein